MGTEVVEFLNASRICEMSTFAFGLRLAARLVVHVAPLLENRFSAAWIERFEGTVLGEAKRVSSLAVSTPISETVY